MTAALFEPFTLRGVTFPHRLVMSPMCQYSCRDGMADDWHLVHLGSRAVGGVGTVIAEATAVTAEGRISPADLGLWSDAHAEPLARIARFLESRGSVPGIQLAHAGRKASHDVPWRRGHALAPAAGRWTVVAPSALPYADGSPLPRALDTDGIEGIQEAFVAAARRAVDAGFRLVELHAAHGYLAHTFLSPLSNQRTDRYGGSLENRMRFVLELAEKVRAALPADMPLFTRLSATDWVDGGWDLEQSVALVRELKRRGVDLIDVSSGGLSPKQRIPVEAGYQVPFAERLRKEGIATGAVGLVTEPKQAEAIVASGQADLVLLGRQLLRDPYFVQRARRELGVPAAWPVQYERAVLPLK